MDGDAQMMVRLLICGLVVGIVGIKLVWRASKNATPLCRRLIRSLAIAALFTPSLAVNEGGGAILPVLFVFFFMPASEEWWWLGVFPILVAWTVVYTVLAVRDRRRR